MILTIKKRFLILLIVEITLTLVVAILGAWGVNMITTVGPQAIGAPREAIIGFKDAQMAMFNYGKEGKAQQLEEAMGLVKKFSDARISTGRHIVEKMNDPSAKETMERTDKLEMKILDALNRLRELRKEGGLLSEEETQLVSETIVNLKEEAGFAIEFAHLAEGFFGKLGKFITTADIILIFVIILFGIFMSVSIMFTLFDPLKKLTSITTTIATKAADLTQVVELFGNR